MNEIALTHESETRQRRKERDAQTRLPRSHQPSSVTPGLHSSVHSITPFATDCRSVTGMRMAECSITGTRKNRKGIRSSDFYSWPDQPFEEMDSTVAVQQLIQQTIRRNPEQVDEILSPPEGQEDGSWKYEHLRQFCMELNGLAVRLQAECSPTTCSQMTATEQWIFLCAAHKTPKECPAIDYTRHTLDGAACLLNSNKYFPSRVTIKDSSVAKLGSVCRRVYRIFSHAFFHHRTIFDQFESRTHLCRRFTVFVTKYQLMSRDNLIVPLDESPAAPAIAAPADPAPEP